VWVTWHYPIVFVHHRDTRPVELQPGIPQGKGFVGALCAPVGLGISPAKLAKTAKLRNQFSLRPWGWVAFARLAYLAREIPLLVRIYATVEFVAAAVGK